MILNLSGYTATAFDDPEKALAAASTWALDFLITEVMMRKMNGIELAQFIRQANPTCKVILISGQAATNDLLEKARDEGHDFEILAKPVHPAELLAKLRELS